MHIRRICIDQFGNWSHLQLNDLAAGLVVFYGTNGSGKSTIAHFLRSVFCGFDGDAQRRLAEARVSGRVGSLTVRDETCECTLQRFVDGRDGRLGLLDSQGQELPDSRHVGPLFAASPSQWDRAFWVDFEHRPDLRQLIDQAWDQGFELIEPPMRRDRLQQLERTVQSHRTTLDGLPRAGQPLAVLRDKQKETQRQLERLAVLWASGTTDQRQRIADSDEERDRLQWQLDTLLAERQQIQDRLGSVRQDVRIATRPLSSELRRSQLGALDAQLQRWRSVLDEVVERRRVVEQSVGTAAPPAPPTSPYSSLRLLDQRLDRLLSEVHRISGAVASPQCHCSELKSGWAGPLQVLRDQISELRGDLLAWEQGTAGRDTLDERYRLRRCEDELRTAIGGLLRQRSELVDELSESSPRSPATGPEPVSRVVANAGWICSSDSDAAWSGQREGLEQRLRHLDAAIDDVRSRLARHDAPHAHSAAEEAAYRRQSEELLAEHRRLQAAIGAEERGQGLREQIARLEAEIADLRAEERVPQIVQEASRYLRRLTGESLVELRVQPDRSVTVTNRRGDVRSAAQLASGEGDQVYMSIALSLVSAWRRRGVSPPLIWDDACMHLDLGGARAAAQLLSDLAQDGEQVLWFTRHEAVAEALKLLGADVRLLHEVRLAEPLPIPVALPLPDHGRMATEPTLPVAPIAPAVVEPARPRVPDPSQSDYFLTEASPIEDAPSIDAANAVRMRKLGLATIGDLLRVTPETLAESLVSAGVTPAMVRVWQSEAGLVCRVPRLRCFDARILVACGITHPSLLLQVDPDDLRRRVEQFSRTSEGQILLGVGTEFEVSRLLDWVRARHRNRPHRGITRNGSEAGSDRSSQRSTHRTSPSRAHPASSEPRSNRRHGEDPSERDGEQSDRRNNYRVVPEADEEESHVRPAAASAGAAPARYFLNMSDPVDRAPSIGGRLADSLTALGVRTVRHLIDADPEQIAERLANRRVKADTVRAWQQQAELVCRIPELRGHDAQILVACGVTAPKVLAASDPDELTNHVAGYVATNEGKRVLRGSPSPDRDEIESWISYAQQARSLRAA